MITVSTQRFGSVQRPEADVMEFPNGIFGFERQTEWLLLADAQHGSLFWLQSVQRGELSLAVLDPREFVLDYQLHVRRSELAGLGEGTEPLVVLCVLGEYQTRLAINLRNPIVLNPARRTGRQLVSVDSQPLQYLLPAQPDLLREAA